MAIFRQLLDPQATSDSEVDSEGGGEGLASDPGPSRVERPRYPFAADHAGLDAVYGLGAKARAALEATGVRSVGDLRALFRDKLGSSGEKLAAHIHGLGVSLDGPRWHLAEIAAQLSATEGAVTTADAAGA
jgi:hypothetical protein